MSDYSQTLSILSAVTFWIILVSLEF